jgi:hypothetical protein
VRATESRRHPRPRSRAEAAALLALFGLLLVVPSADYQYFDGLPASRLAEFLGAVLLAPFAASRVLRRAYARLVGAMWPAARGGLLALGVVALAAKVVLLASGTHAGFFACYRSPITAPPAGPCEKSYENPFARFGITRLDRRLDFAPLTWDLSFINSNRFNIYPWIKGNVVRDRLPLAVTWSGTVDRAQAWTAEVRYVGAAAVRVGSMEPSRLPSRYDALAIATIPIPAGRHDLRIDYEFDDGSRIGDGRAHGPYATFRLSRPGAPEAIVPVRPSRAWRGVAALADLAVLLLAATMAVACARALAGEAWITAAVALAAAASPWLDRVSRPLLPPGAWLVLLLALLLGRLILDGRPRRLLGAYLGIIATALVFAWRRLGRLQMVSYRAAGDDWLTYESLARSILDTGSLHGGEDVFYYQPLFRYVRFAEHYVLGDGDALVLTWGIAALSWGLLWACAVVLGRRRRRPGAIVLLALTGLLWLLLATSRTVLDLIHLGVSEYPTWIALPLFVPLLFVSSAARAWLLGAGLLALSLLTRTNHLPAVLVTLALFLWRGWQIRPRAAIAAGVLFGAIALLPALHNSYYGNRLVLLTTSAGIPENLVLPPARLADLARDAEVRSRLWTQLARMLYVVDAPDRIFEVAVRGLQVLWVGAVGAWAITRRPRFPVALLLAVPAAYLVPHVFYQATHGYPRHFLAGYFAMGAVVLLVAERWWRAAARTPSRELR